MKNKRRKERGKEARNASMNAKIKENIMPDAREGNYLLTEETN